MRTYKSTQNETYTCYGESSGFSTCRSTTWSREDAIPKRKGTFFNPKGVNCSGHVANIASNIAEDAWGTYMRPQSRYVTWYIGENAMKCQLVPVRIPRLLEQNVLKTVGRKHIEGSCKVYVGKTNWKTSWKLQGQARSEEYWKHSCRWLLFEQLLFVPKHVTLSQKMPLVLLVSIPLALLTSRSSSEVLSWAHREDLSLDMSEKSEPVPVRISRLLEQNVLKAVCRTEGAELLTAQALDLCVQEIFLQSNLHCHLVKPHVFAVSRIDLLSSWEPNQCCYPECHLAKGAQKGIFFPQSLRAQSQELMERTPFNVPLHASKITQLIVF